MVVGGVFLLIRNGGRKKVGVLEDGGWRFDGGRKEPIETKWKEEKDGMEKRDNNDGRVMEAKGAGESGP